jgi:predicted transcriptional regulator
MIPAPNVVPSLRRQIKRQRVRQSLRFLRQIILVEARRKVAALDQDLVDELHEVGLRSVADLVVRLHEEIERSLATCRREEC